MSAKIPFSIMILTTVVSCIILATNGRGGASAQSAAHGRPLAVAVPAAP